jgi:hypothetical protein
VNDELNNVFTKHDRYMSNRNQKSDDDKTKDAERSLIDMGESKPLSEQLGSLSKCTFEI